MVAGRHADIVHVADVADREHLRVGRLRRRPRDRDSLDRVSIASGPDDRQLCCAAWLDDTHLRVQEATGDGDRAWIISLDAAAHEPELLVDLTDALEAIDPPGQVVLRSAPGDPGRTFQWQPVAETASGS